MGERYTVVVFGCFVDELGECPSEDGWQDYASEHGLFVSYESKSEWIGYEVAVLEYGDIWSPRESFAGSIEGWEEFREEVKHEVSIPEGYLIIAHDE